MAAAAVEFDAAGDAGDPFAALVRALDREADPADIGILARLQSGDGRGGIKRVAAEDGMGHRDLVDAKQIAAAIPALRDHAEEALQGQRADAERVFPFGPRRIPAVVVKLRVVDEIDRLLAIVLLRDVDA